MKVVLNNTVSICGAHHFDAKANIASSLHISPEHSPGVGVEERKGALHRVVDDVRALDQKRSVLQRRAALVGQVANHPARLSRQSLKLAPHDRLRVDVAVARGAINAAKHRRRFPRPVAVPPQECFEV